MDELIAVLVRVDSFLNTTKSATDKEINKAYRKRSLELQYAHSPFTHLQEQLIEGPTRA